METKGVDSQTTPQHPLNFLMGYLNTNEDILAIIGRASDDISQRLVSEYSLSKPKEGDIDVVIFNLFQEYFRELEGTNGTGDGLRSQELFDYKGELFVKADGESDTLILKVGDFYNQYWTGEIEKLNLVHLLGMIDWSSIYKTNDNRIEEVATDVDRLKSIMIASLESVVDTNTAIVLSDLYFNSQTNKQGCDDGDCSLSDFNSINKLISLSKIASNKKNMGLFKYIHGKLLETGISNESYVMFIEHVGESISKNYITESITSKAIEFLEDYEIKQVTNSIIKDIL